jgi:hypothetical protein
MGTIQRNQMKLDEKVEIRRQLYQITRQIQLIRDELESLNREPCGMETGI